MQYRLVCGDWSDLGCDAQLIRREVFINEQKVPEEMEWDEMDMVSLHAVAYDSNGEVIGTGRLLPDGHIGRMAVKKDIRTMGVGSGLLKALMDEARARRHRFVIVSAQLHAEAFYRRFGFVREGQEFMDAGIAHIKMRREFP